MDIQVIQEALLSPPMTTGSRVHHLDPGAPLPPNYDKMGHPIGQADHGNGRQRPGFGQKHMINWNHNLLCRQAKLIGDLFQGINGGPIDIGLASFAQAAIADRDTKAL